jgi:hypothetical protein
LQAFFRSNDAAFRAPSFAWTMLAVAGSVTSCEAELKMSRSISSAGTAEASRAWRAAATARSDAFSPGPAIVSRDD